MFESMKWRVALVLCALMPSFVQADAAIKDGGVEISEEELQVIIQRWPSDVKKAAANDLGSRMELLSSAVAGRKMAKELNQMTPESDGAAYWAYQDALLSFQRQQRTKQFVDSIEYPNMEALAQERYQTEKDKYAKVPEKRLTSHILLQCLPGKCEREPVREQAAALIAELRKGADFEAMVAEHSDDPGSKTRGGRFNRWMQIGEPGVMPTYSGGAFTIEEIGGYSDPVDTEFGIHIIRLDDLRPEHYKPYAEVRPKILEDLLGEYKQLKLREFNGGYVISDKAYINGDVVEKLLAPYKKN